MDKLYYRALDDITRALTAVKAVMDDAPAKMPEDIAAYRVMETLSDQLDRAKCNLNYLATPTKEGRLREENNGKFCVVYNDGTESYPLSCSSSLEIPDPEEDPEENQGWLIGRVEGRMTDQGNQYYFYGGAKPALHEGMRARKREVR